MMKKNRFLLPLKHIKEGMRKIVIENTPGTLFWKKYSELWYCSIQKSPFQSPLLLQYFAGVKKNNIVAVQLIVDEKLKAAIVLSEKNGTFSFLSDLKTDVNFLVVEPDCTAGDLEFFFSSFFGEIRKRGWNVILNNVPNWANYMKAFEYCGAKSKLFFKKIDYSVCPVIEGNQKETVFDIVKHSRQIRYSINRLRGQLNAVFEVLTGDEELENWTNQFCQSHILRWESTPTPSGYRSLTKQQFLLNCLRAWSAQKILVRFSVIVNNQRIGFVIGLIDNNSLIHHSTTFHPEYRRFSAGKAVIYIMAEWILKNNLNTLDFGDGDEEYKLALAKKLQVTSRIFISSSSNFRFILTTKLIEAVRNNSGLYRFYRDKVRRHLKQKINSAGSKDITQSGGIKFTN